MSITVQTFNEEKAKEVLKTCPKIVQEYVKLLKKAIEGQERVTSIAIARIRELTK